MEHRLRAGLAVVVLSVWTLFALSGAATAGVFNPETFTLANGMQVVVITNHRMPVVTHMVWYKAGAADEPPGRSGLAHLLEHLMFKGTARHPGTAFSRIVASNGGQENAFTTYDYTAYYQSVAKDRLGLMMELEADRMANLAFDDAAFTGEKDVVLEERRQRIDNDPAALLSERADATFFVNSNYRRPVIGWEHEIRALSADDLRTFYRTWYRPNNAVLVVAGDVTVDEVRPLAEKTYGALAAAPVPAHLVLAEPPPLTEGVITLRNARVRQPAWTRHFPAPGYGTEPEATADALEVLAEALGGGPTSRLYRALVVEAGKAVSASAGYDPSKRGPARLTIAASPRPGVTTDELQSLIEAEIAKVVREGFGAEEIARTKDRLISQAIYARDTLSTGAYVLGEALALGRAIEDVETWPDRIAAVSAEQVNAVARTVLDDRHAVTVLLLANGADGAATASRAEPGQ